MKAIKNIPLILTFFVFIFSITNIWGQGVITSPSDNSEFPQGVGTIALTATPASGAFSGSGVTNSGGGTGTFDISQAPGTYIITYSKSGGGGYTTSITIEIVAAGTVTFNPPTPVCLTYPVVDLTLYASPAGGNFSGTGVIGVSDFDPSIAGLGTHTLSYTSGATTVNADVTVEPEFTALLNAGSATTFCTGGSVTLTADPLDGDSYSWYQNGVLISTAIGNSYTATTSGNYFVEITRSNCTETSNTIAVTVNPLPVNKTITSTNYCQGASGGTVTIPLSEAGVTYYLYTTPGNVLTKSPIAGNGANRIWNSVAAGSYYVIARNLTTGCELTLNTVTVVMNALPSFGTGPFADDNPICNGNSTQLHANVSSVAPIVSFTWDNAATLDDNTIEEPISSTISSTNYHVTVVDGNGCSNNGSLLLTVNSLPNININSGTGLFTICQNSSISLTGTFTPVSAATYAWSNGGNTASITVSPTTSETYTLTVTDAFGCSNSESQLVTVNPLPTANAGSDVIMCDGVGVTLHASATGGAGGYTYLWSGGTTPALQDNLVIPTADASFNVTVTDANGCKHSDGVNVDWKQNPSATLSVVAPNDLNICDGESTVIDITPSGGTPAYSYVWAHDGSNSDPATINSVPIALDGTPIITNYVVTVYDANLCSSTANINVITSPLSSLIIYNDGESYCQNTGNVTLNADKENASSLWTSSDFTIIGADQFSTASLDITVGGHVVDYQYTNSYGCTSSVTGLFTILPYSPPVIMDITTQNGPDYCHTDPGPWTIEGIMTPDLQGQTAIVENLTFSGAAGFTYTGNGIGLLDPQAAGQGTYTFTYTVTTGGACDRNYSENITIGLPVTIAAPADMCVGDVDQVLTASDVTGLWTITFTDLATFTPTTIGPIAYADPMAVLQATQAGTYNISYEVSNAGIGCTNSTTATCVVHALPVLTFDIGTFNHNDLNINFCTNDVEPILVGYSNGLPAGGGLFSGVGVTAALFDPAVGAGNYTITYDYTDANSCANTVTSNNIRVNLAPVVDISGLNANYCADDPLISVTGDPITGSLGFGVFNFPATWTLGNEYTNPGDGTATIDPSKVLPTGTFSLDYVVDDANGCSGTITEFFAINPLPTVDFNGFPAIVAPALHSQICQNAAPILLTGNPTTADGIFTGDGITDNGNGTATFDPSTETVGIHTITYTWTNPATGCVNSIDKDIEIWPLPLTYSVTAPMGLNYCSSGVGIKIGVSDSEDATNTYYLMRNGVTQMDVQSGTSNPFTFTGDFTAATYTVIAENQEGCQLSFAGSVVPIEEPAIGDAGSITGNANVCADGVTVYNYSVPTITNATDHVWTIPAVGVTLDADNGDDIDVIFDNIFVTGTFEVFGEDPASICPAGNNNTITVTALPEPIDNGAIITSSTGVFVFCEGTTGVVFAVDQTDYSDETSFLWEIVSGGYTITSVTTGSSINVDFPIGCSSGSIRARAVNACGVSTWLTQAITVNPIPNVSINALGAGDVITCDPASRVTLNAASTENPADISSWLWTPSNGGIIDGAANIISASASHEGDFEVQIGVTTNLLECYNTATIPVGADKTAPTATIDAHSNLNCTTLSVSLKANSTAPSSYLWSFTPPAHIAGATNVDNPVVDAPGVYTVTVTDLSNSCTGSASTNVTENVTLPNISVTDPPANHLTCLVGNVTVQGNSTTLPASYLWTGPGTANITTPGNLSTSVDVAGIYTFQVTDLTNGCSDTRTVTVTEDITSPIITAVNNNDGGDLTCSNTIVQLEAVAAGTPTATFAWSTITGTIVGLPYGANNQFIDVSGPGSYTATATDPANGCTSAPSSQTVNQVITTTNTASVIGGPFVLTCTNGGQVTLDGVTTGNPGGTYLWTTAGGNIIAPVNTEDVVVDAAGSYTFHYYDPVTSCQASATIIVTDNQNLPNVSINPGPYVVNCITPTPVLSANADIDPLTTYLWSGPVGATINNDATLNPDVDMAGLYTITATGTNGCQRTASVNVSLNNTPPDISVDVPDDRTCTNTNPTISGSSSAAVTYLWTRLTGTANIDVPTANTTTVDDIGQFQLEVTSTVNGCKNSAIVDVFSDYTSPAISVTSPASDVLTCDVTSVQVEATSVIVGVTYSWSTGIAGATITNTAAAAPFVNKTGNYTVVGTHPVSGCTETATVFVNENMLAPAINLTSAATELNCNVTSISINGTGTTNADSYNWTNSVGGNIVSGQGTNSIVVNAPGNYTLVAENSTTGCTSTLSYPITENVTLPTIAINGGTYEISCSAPVETIGAVGDANPLTTYFWSGPGIVGINTGLNISVNTPGSYSVTATAPNGCSSTDNVTVNDNTQVPDLTTNLPDDITCINTSVTISGTSSVGVGSSWTRILGSGNIAVNNVPTTTVDGPGTFRITITSLANGCSNFADVVVDENMTLPGLGVVSPASDILTCNTVNVQLDATVTEVGSSFNWTTAIPLATISDPSVAQPFVDKAGVYNVLATHPVSGCTETFPVTVGSDFSVPTITIIPNATIITCTQTSIQLNASTSANATNFNWVATAGGNITSGGTNAIATVSKGGTYTLTAEHPTTGCEISGVQIITENIANPTVLITSAPDITCTTPTPVLTATASANTSVIWAGPSGASITNGTSLSPTVNMAGTYTITATSTINGCTATDNILVETDNAVPDISVNLSPLPITCSNTTTQLIGNSVTPSASFLWQVVSGSAVITNAANPTATVNDEGVFSFTVTAPNGCTSAANVSVGKNITAPQISLPAIDDQLLMCNTPKVTLNGSSTTLNALFSWSTLISGATITNPGSPTPLVNKDGIYTLTVTDPSNGCTSTGTTQVNYDYSAPNMVVAVPGQITCTNPTLQLDATTSTGTTTYSWVATNGGHILADATTAQPTIDAAGRYTVTGIHNVTGCTDTEFVDVTKDNSVPDIDDYNATPDELNCNISTVTLKADATSLGTKSILWNTVNGHFVNIAETTTATPTVDAPGTYTATITNTLTGCSAVFGVTVVQNITPPVVTITDPLELTCSRLQVGISTSASSVDNSSLAYSWAAGAGGNIVSGPATSNPVVSLPADYFVTVTDQGNHCTTNTSVTVDLNDTPPGVSVDKTPDRITCSQAKVQLTGSTLYANPSYHWSTTGSGTIENPTTTTPMVNLDGTYFLTVTNNDNGCTSIDSVIVLIDTVHPVVTLNAPSNEITCALSSATLTATQSTDYSYLWSGPAGIQTPNSYTTVVTNAGVYTLKVEDISNGCKSYYSRNVNLNNTPSATPVIDISNREICLGEANPTFTEINGNIVKWYADAGLTALSGTGSTFTPSAAISAAGTYSFYATYTGSNGCVSPQTQVTLTIHALPTLPITTDNYICAGSTATSLYAAGSNISWYNSSLVFQIGGNSFIPSDTTVGTYTYFATQTDANGCESNRKAVTYSIYAVPGAPSFVDPEMEICQTTTNPIFTALGNNIKWYKTLGGSFVASGNTYQPNVVVPSIYKFYATQTVNNCTSNPDSATFTIHTLPTKFNVSGGGSYCEETSGIEVGLEDSQAGTNYELWLDDATLVGDEPGTGTDLSFGDQMLEGTYTVFAENTTTGCRSKMNGSTTVTINPLPAIPGNISGNSTVCQAETGVVYSITPVADAVSYNWEVPAGFTITNGEGSNSITVEIASSANNGSIRVNAINGCDSSSFSPLFNVTVKKIPSDALSINGTFAVCQLEKGIVFSTPAIPNATSYVWTLPVGATLVAGANTRQITVDFTTSAITSPISVYGKSSCGNGATFSQTVNVSGLPVINAGLEINECTDHSQLNANSLSAGESGEWSIHSGIVTFADIAQPKTTITAIGRGKNQLVWTVTNANGCINRDTIDVYNNTVFVNAGNDQVLCSKTTALNALVPLTNGTWGIASGNANILDSESPVSTVTALYQDENRFVWKVVNRGCESTDTVSIFNYLPSVPNAGPDQFIESDVTTLGAKPVDNAETVGTWSVKTGFGNIASPHDPESAVTDLSAGINIFTWTVTYKNNCPLTDEVTIENQMMDDPEAGDNQLNNCEDFCFLDAINPDIGEGEWFVISGNADFDDPKDPKTRAFNLGHGENLLKWRVRTAFTAEKYDSVVVTNNKPTTANAGINISLCTDSYQLQANKPLYGSGEWIINSGSCNIQNDTLYNSLVDNLVQGNTKLTWKIANKNCFSESSVTLTNNMPTTANAGMDTTICFDSTQLYPNTPNPDTETAKWQALISPAFFVGNTVVNLAADTNYLIYTIQKANCYSYDTLRVVNNKPTTPEVDPIENICTDSLFMDANLATQGIGIWHRDNGSGVFADSSDNNTLVTDIKTGANTYYWEITKNGCSERDYVVVNNNYIESYAGKDQEDCESEFQLSGSNPSPGDGTWSFGLNSGGTIAEPNNPNATVTNLLHGYNSIIWTVQNENCQSKDTVVVGNFKPTQANAGIDFAPCSKSYSLKANTAEVGQGVWTLLSGAGAFVDSLNPKTTINGLGVGPNHLRWIITEKECISFDDIIITSNLPVDVSAGEDLSVCSNAVEVFANPPTIGSGEWKIGVPGEGNFENPDEFHTTVRNLAKGENYLIWTVKSADDCKVSDTLIITSNVPTTSIVNSSLRIACADTFIMDANSPVFDDGEIGTWEPISGSFTIDEPNNPHTKISDVGLGENVLQWTINLNGCESSARLTLVNNLPSTPQLAFTDIAICGDSVRIFAVPPTVGTGQWSPASGYGEIDDDLSNETVVNNIKFGENTFRWTITHLNCKLWDDVHVTNNYEFVNAGADTTINISETQLIGNIPTKGVGRWEISASPATILNPDNFETRVTGLGSGANVFTWTITNNNCTSTDDVIIDYIVMPIADFEPTAIKGCPPLTISFVNKATGGVGTKPLSWDFGDGETSTDPNPVHEYTEPGTYWAVLTVQGPLGLSVLKDTLITIYENPKAEFDIAPDTIYVPGERISCFNYSKHVVSSIWYFGDGKNIEDFAPTYSYDSAGAGTYDIALRVTTVNGCTDSLMLFDAVEVINRSEFIFPEAFTPNPFGSSGGQYDPKDRSNDVFFPMIINGEITDYTMNVFNRLGVLVFSTSDVQIGWDGYYKGKRLPQDVYIYIVEGRYNNGQPFQKTGNVLLIVKDY